jgi:hypothetical protein
MRSTFEELGGTYKQVGDYLLPDVEVPETPEVGFWGIRQFHIPIVVLMKLKSKHITIEL